MKKQSLIALTLGLVASHNLYAACAPVTAPTLVDGSVAPLEELVANQGDVKTYMADANKFLECLDKEEAEAVATGTETEETKQARTDIYNAAVDTMNNIAADFNAEIQKYKARN